MSFRALHKELASLSPEQRALFARRLAESGFGAQAPEILPRPANGGPVPASLVQQRLWLLDQMEPGNPFYNLPLLCFRMAGTLDARALAGCFREIERRHESLRTVFTERDGFPYQAVLPPGPRPMPVVDLSALPDAVREPAAWALAREESRRLFDLAVGPLWRTHLLRLSEREHLLLVTMHHIISDAWSLGVFYRELSALYTAALAGEPSPLAEPPVQYPDFAIWQRERLQGERLEEEVRFWRAQLAGAPDKLELPTDFPRPAVRTYGGERITLDLPAELPEALAELSQRTSASLYMVLLAGLDALLHRYSHQDDVVLGAPVAGRTHMETEGLIGFFVNTVVFRVPLGGDPTFRDLLARVRDVVLDVYEHQELPFDRLVEALRPRRDPSYGPIFQAMFSLQNTPSPDLALPDLTVTPKGINNGTSQTDLILFAGMSRGRLGILQLEYNTGLFEEATVLRMERHLLTLLAAAVADPDLRLSDLPMLSEAEREQTRAWGRAEVHGLPVRPIPRLFEEQAAARPDATAATCGDLAVTYRELDRRANALAHKLRELGVEPEVPVGICAGRGLPMVVGLLGILKAGGSYVPLDPAYPPERLALMTDEARVLLVEEPFAASFSGFAGPRLTLPELAGIGEAERPPDPAGLLPEHPAYVIYTSGSTGRPKGVAVTHSNVARLLAATRPLFEFGPDDVWSLFFSYAFDFSVWEIWGALLHGGRLVVVPQDVVRSPRDLHRLLSEERVTVLNQTPSAFQQLIQADGEEPRPLALREVIFGGEALEPRSLAPWFERNGDQHPRLVNMYGITETIVHVTFRPLSAADARSHRSLVGGPMPDLSLRLLGPRWEEVPVGVPGEIHVGGDGLARGYLNRPDLTAARFLPDPFSPGPGARLYRSGDLARWTPEGDVEFLGRIDHQVKVRGFRIELGEIESALGRHPGLRAVVADVREVSAGNPGIVAWYVPAEANGGGPLDPTELRAFLRRSLPEYMLPAAFQPLAALPTTASGKVDRRALPAPEREGSAAFAPPQGEMEEAVAAIWRELLAVERVGREDDFFELGGHSLLATRLASRLRDRFQRDLSAKTVFLAPRLAALARAVEGAAEAAEPALAVIPRRARHPRRPQ